MENLNDTCDSQVKACFTNYINVVIKNASINFKKKKQSLESIELEYNEQIKDISLLSNDISFFDSCELYYPYEQLENYFSSYKLYTIIKKLPTRYKQILYYTAIKDYDYKQISLIMGISESNVRNIKSRAIKKINNNMKILKEDESYE